MIRIRFSAASVRAIKTRATDLSGRTYCELCGAECPTRDSYEIDHVVPEGLRLDYDPRLPLSAEHGKLVCLKCHAKKTKRDVFEIAKAKRLSEKHRVVSSGQTEIARRYGIKQERDK
jgi:HNH endonuclease